MASRTPSRRRHPARTPSIPAEEAQQAILRYQLVRGLHESSRLVAELADRFAAAAATARDLAAASAERKFAGGKPSRALKPLVDKLQKKLAAATRRTRNLVADKFLDDHAFDLLARRVGTSFDPAVAVAAEVARFAGALDEVAAAARRLPTGVPDGLPDEEAALRDLVAWAEQHQAGAKPLARLLTEAELDPPGWDAARKGDRVAAWQKKLVAAGARK